MTATNKRVNNPLAGHLFLKTKDNEHCFAMDGRLQPVRLPDPHGTVQYALELPQSNGALVASVLRFVLRVRLLFPIDFAGSVQVAVDALDVGGTSPTPIVQMLLLLPLLHRRLMKRVRARLPDGTDASVRMRTWFGAVQLNPVLTNANLVDTAVLSDSVISGREFVDSARPTGSVRMHANLSVNVKGFHRKSVSGNPMVSFDITLPTTRGGRWTADFCLPFKLVRQHFAGVKLRSLLEQRRGSSSTHAPAYDIKSLPTRPSYNENNHEDIPLLLSLLHPLHVLQLRSLGDVAQVQYCAAAGRNNPAVLLTSDQLCALRACAYGACCILQRRKLSSDVLQFIFSSPYHHRHAGTRRRQGER
jgi:hypothetical protein